MAHHVQQQFAWSEEEPTTSIRSGRDKTEPDHQPELETAGPLEEIQTLGVPKRPDVPIAKPLPLAVEHGVFGQTSVGPFEPDEEDVKATTEEQVWHLTALWKDIQAVEDSIRTGEDPRTGKVPKTEQARVRLAEYLPKEEASLKRNYAMMLAAYAEGFGEEAAAKLDTWVRKYVADGLIGSPSYDPGHPWHYYHEGDNAQPVPVEAIEPDIEAGRYIERQLPKNPAKRTDKMRALLAEERERVAADKRRYQEIVERGAEALSRFDREFAHTSDEMAVATALALKYSHIRFGLGRLAWLEAAVAKGGGLVHNSRNSAKGSTGGAGV